MKRTVKPEKQAEEKNNKEEESAELTDNELNAASGGSTGFYRTCRHCHQIIADGDLSIPDELVCHCRDGERKYDIFF